MVGNGRVAERGIIPCATLAWAGLDLVRISATGFGRLQADVGRRRNSVVGFGGIREGCHACASFRSAQVILSSDGMTKITILSFVAVGKWAYTFSICN